MSLNGNIYVDARGATPREREQIRQILADHYGHLRAALKDVYS
jgi:predicted RNA-binding protein with PUA domain